MPILNRIGLRYIDDCPFSPKTTEAFLNHFNSCLSTQRFPIEDSSEHQYKALVKKGEYALRYVETLKPQPDPPILNLDFDGFALNIQSAKCLEITDQLHTMISEEYEATIKQPVFNYMRGE